MIVLVLDHCDSIHIDGFFNLSTNSILTNVRAELAKNISLILTTIFANFARKFVNIEFVDKLKNPSIHTNKWHCG